MTNSKKCNMDLFKIGLTCIIGGMANYGLAKTPKNIKPNIIVINCDDMGYGDLSCFGNPTIKTPNLDKMALEGQKWTSFYVSASVSSPSRAGLLTGRLGVRTGMYGNDKRVLFPDSPGGLPQEEHTIPELLKTVGYHTGCIGKWHLGHLPKYMPLEHGFDYFYGYPYSNDMSRIEKGKMGYKNYPYEYVLYEQDKVVEKEPDQHLLTQQVTQAAVRYIESHANTPFFLYVAHPMPHIPVYASNDFQEKSARGQYGDVIEELDWSTGLILQTLKEAGLDKNTLVIFTSDNGPWLSYRQQGGNAGTLKDGKASMYEGGFRVPCIMWGAMVSPATITDMGSTLDLLPTFCELANVELPNDRVYDGISLLNVLKDKSASKRNEFYFYRGNDLYAVRKGKYKLHLAYKSAYGNDKKKVYEMPVLYDLGTDPGEHYNIAKNYPEVVKELTEMAQKHKDSFIPENSLFDMKPMSTPKYPFLQTNLTTEERVEDLIQRMTLDEKIDLLTGYQDFYLHPCERLGIPAFKLADGPLGISSWGVFGKATAFPSALSLAASWNRNLANLVGNSYGQECRARGIHFLLAPGVNIYRSSKCGRNFEYFGEDPYLTSEMVVPFIKGVQSKGVIATVKHFIGNEQEYDRYNVSSEISERALREIYLPPFKAAVQQAGVKAVMTSYNPLNGVYCTENKYLIDILKKEWGFKWMLMSDWACTYSADKAANHGLDLEMGSHSWFIKEKLLPLIKQGVVTKETIDEKVRRIYGACIEMGFFDRPQKDASIPVYNPQANRLAYKAVCEGIVLLKNENDLLPLKKVSRIAVIGPNACHNLVSDRLRNVNTITYGGGGCSKVHPWYVTSVLQGIEQEFPQAEVLYSEGIPYNYKNKLFQSSQFRTKDGKNGLTARYYKIGNGYSSNSSSEELMAMQARAAGRTYIASDEQRGVSHKNHSSDSAVMERVDRNVNFTWWNKPNKELGDDYKVEWEGYVHAERNDSIFFFVDAQGGYRLWIDEKLCIDAFSSQSFHYGQVVLPVSKGKKLYVKLEYLNQRSRPAEIHLGYDYKGNLDFSESLSLARKADVVVFCAGLNGDIEKESRDRPFQLPFGQKLLMNEIAKVNPNMIVSLHAGGAVEMEPWIDSAKAVLHLFYPGQEGGKAFAEILSGKVNPSAKLPFSIERRWEDSPSCGNYDETRKEKKVFYNEGIFVGYRGYDRKRVEPLFPFGYGLSYTSFQYSDLDVEIFDRDNKYLKLSFDLSNTGNHAGAEVAQVYVHDKVSKEIRPLKELKGFEKVFLGSGETKKVTLWLNKEDFKYFSEKKNKWIFESGEFELWIGSSSQDIRIKKTVHLK
jgi:putative beta-glucosidase